MKRVKLSLALLLAGILTSLAPMVSAENAMDDPYTQIEQVTGDLLTVISSYSEGYPENEQAYFLALAELMQEHAPAPPGPPLLSHVRAEWCGPKPLARPCSCTHHAVPHRLQVPSQHHHLMYSRAHGRAPCSPGPKSAAPRCLRAKPDLNWYPFPYKTRP